MNGQIDGLSLAFQFFLLCAGVSLVGFVLVAFIRLLLPRK